MNRNRIIHIDILKGLRKLPRNSVDVVITSPPYWQLRDYHVDGQTGMEEFPDDYLKTLWGVFDEVRRVLKDEGTCWVNLGDKFGTDKTRFSSLDTTRKWNKCLLALPERFMLGMLERGWTLRNKIIFHKPNALPSSVKDRFSCTWEYLFLFVKARRYYFDLDAVREPHKGKPTNHSALRGREDGLSNGIVAKANNESMRHRTLKTTREFMSETGIMNQASARMYVKKSLGIRPHPVGRNPGDCWIIATQPFKGAHFATFPERLVEQAIKTSPPKICARCGCSWRRLTRVEKIGERSNVSSATANAKKSTKSCRIAQPNSRYVTKRTTIGWEKCKCKAGVTKALILDPFCGSGTTCLVAKRLGRDYLGFDINPEYVRMARERLRLDPKDRAK